MGRSVRTTFSLPAEQHSELLRIADDSHVSTAWVVREAVRIYLAERYPLLQDTGKTHPMGQTEKSEKKR